MTVTEILNVEILANAKQLTDAMRKANKSIAETGQKMRAFGQKMSLAVTTPLALAGGAAIKFASDAEETRSKFNVIFGDMAKQSQEWAESFGASVGRARTDVMGWMATLGDTFKPLGFTTEEAAKLSAQLTKLTVDLGSFNNMADPEVLASLQSAIVGNHETMRKFGVIINETNLQQEIFALGLARTKDEITEQMKVQARLSLIMKGTKDAQGDALRTAGSFANQMKALRANVKNVAEDMGNALMPAVQKLVGVVKRGVDWFAKLDETTRNAGLAALALMAAIGPLTTAVGYLLTPVGLVMAGITLAAAAWLKWEEEIKAFMATMDTYLDKLANAGDSISLFVHDAVAKMGEWIGVNMEADRRVAESLRNQRNNADESREIISGAYDNLKESMKSALEDMKGFFADFLGSHTQTTQSVIQNTRKMGLEVLHFRDITSDFVPHYKKKMQLIATESTKSAISVETAFSRMQGAVSALSQVFGSNKFTRILGGILSLGASAISITSGAATSFLKSLPGIFKGIGRIAHIFGFQHGGIVTRPTLGMVGEKGPEAVIPLSRTGQARGVGGVNLTVNIYGSVGVDDIGDQLVRRLHREGIVTA